MPARSMTSGASASPAAATSTSRPWVSSPSASVCRNGSCTGAQPEVSTAGSCAQIPPLQTSVVQASPSSAHASPSARGAPAMHPAASWPGSAGAHTAAVHASGGTQRLSIGTCWQPPAVQTSSVHEKPSSQPPPPAQSACGSVVLVGSEGRRGEGAGGGRVLEAERRGGVSDAGGGGGAGAGARGGRLGKGGGGGERGERDGGGGERERKRRGGQRHDDGGGGEGEGER